MWSDLNMRDRHKLIRLAVTNGVYDLDTIHSLYDNTQNNYDEGGPIGRKLIKDINSRSTADFVKRLQDKNREYIVNPDGTVSTHRLSWATDNQGNAIVYPEVQNTPSGLIDYSYDRNKAFEEALRSNDTLMMNPSQAEWFTTHYKKYYPSFKYDKGGNMKIAPYKDNSSYTDRKLYRNVKRDFRKDPELEYKDYDEYGVRIYNPSISSNAPNRKERQEAMLKRIRQDFPEIQKNDVKKTAFKSNSLGWHNNNTGYMGNEDKRTLFGLQQNYDFVSNIVPYAKLGMETPESIQRREELERRNRNTTFDYTNNFDIGGDLQTEPNRPEIDTQPIINRIRANNLAKYAIRNNELQQIQDLTDRMYEEEIKRRTMGWLNPSGHIEDNYGNNNYVDIRTTIPTADSKFTFIKTYRNGGIL